jgi:hypothetical protein
MTDRSCAKVRELLSTLSVELDDDALLLEMRLGFIADQSALLQA